MISVVIPTHTSGKYLSKCLKSIQDQTKKADEIILVDDASSDETPRIARKFPSVRYFRVEYHQANRTRNFGFKKSSEDFVIFFDADDYMRKDCLAKLYAALKKNPKVAFAYSDQIEETKKGHKVIRKIRKRSFSWDYERLKKDNYIAMPTLIRRKYFKGFDEKLKRLQDWDLWLSISRKAPGVYLSQPLFFRRFHQKGITSSADLFEADSYIRKKHNLSKMTFVKKMRIKLGQSRQNIIGDLWNSR